MRIAAQQTILSATDLSSFFECEHKTVLDQRLARGELSRPRQSVIERKMLEKRGREHEARVLASFEEQGLKVCKLDRAQPGAPLEEKVRSTLEAMREGWDVIYQGTLASRGWVGRPDFLLRVAANAPKVGPGQHCYEPVDAKLAREEKARAILQLCVYADLLEQLQGALPASIHLALGPHEVSLHAMRTADFIAYYRQSKTQLQSRLLSATGPEPYPEPVEYCDVCEWWRDCEKRRRDDDHLSLVAGITRRQRTRLEDQGVHRLVDLARLPEGAAVSGVDSAVLDRIQHQARLQEQSRSSQQPIFELLTETDPGTGLEALPLPKPGDLFLDLEGDAFVHDGGLEYLFGLLELGQPEDGFLVREQPGQPNYLAYWATNRAEEKRAFEQVIDRIQAGLEEFTDLHVFHFGHRENAALKTLACRHATREDEVDDLLRRGVLVDLHTVVRHALRASVEAYTLKELEVLHGFQRQVDRRAAARAMQWFGWWLETGDSELNVAELRQTLARYNEDDCRSTLQLRNWLEARRPELQQQLGRALTRPERKEDQSEADDQREQEAERVAAQLLAGLPENPQDDSEEHRACRLMANLLGWHWRELKSSFWEYHQAREEPPSDWLESRFVLAGLEYTGEVGTIKQSILHRYTFPEQEHAVKSFPGAEVAGGDGKGVTVHHVSHSHIDLKRGKHSREPHPNALRPGRPRYLTAQQHQLLSVARSIADDGFENRTRYGAARDLLLRRAPRCGQVPNAALVTEGEDTVEAVKRLCLGLEVSVLAVQGPPGSGKTYRAAEAILALTEAGKKVGVTANSHQVILGVLERVHDAAAKAGRPIAIQHIDDPDKYADQTRPFLIAKKHAEVAQRLATGTLQVVGGTHYAWCNDHLTDSVDVLLVDEASQISLANALAVSTAAKSLVLLGDPAQLEQPQKGVHPGGAEVSALEHVLGDALTMPPERGVFLPHTRRLHPDICRFTSEVFYESRLRSLPGLEQQRINGSRRFSGSGLRYVPVPHRGNTNRSEEEVEAVANIVGELLAGNVTFASSSRTAGQPLTPSDILVVAPYNAQVAALQARLGSALSVGTVDKFQGKEAPIVIYSMTTSSGDEAPRGLDFLYSLNRLNVATSRAKALVILVANPELTKARCRTPKQLKMLNALCAYLEKCVQA